MGESETSNLNNKGNRGDNATLAWIHKNCPGGRGRPVDNDVDG